MGSWAGFLLVLATFAQDMTGPVKRVKVNGTELAYVEQGRGPAIVLGSGGHQSLAPGLQQGDHAGQDPRRFHGGGRQTDQHQRPVRTRTRLARAEVVTLVLRLVTDTGGRMAGVVERVRSGEKRRSKTSTRSARSSPRCCEQIPRSRRALTPRTDGVSARGGAPRPKLGSARGVLPGRTARDASLRRARPSSDRGVVGSSRSEHDRPSISAAPGAK
jgi:hypothetical protein